MFKLAVQITTSSIALLLAILHMFTNLPVDEVTIILFVLFIIPWIFPLLKSFELPGGMKIEMRQFEKMTQRIEKTDLSKESNKPKRQDRHVYAFEEVAKGDPNIVIMGLRIEIESKLREIAKSRSIGSEEISLQKLIHKFAVKNILNDEEIESLKDLLYLLEKASHGAEFDKKAQEWVMNIGPRILDNLEDRMGETSVPKLLELCKSQDGGGVADVGLQLSKSFVRSPKAFMKSMIVESECFESWLNGIGHHTFTIFEASDELEDDLYMAYYVKLKELMVGAATKLLRGEFDSQATKIIDKLNQATITRIW